ncbi:DUF4232 domain-containing protein [Streptomyces sp. SID14478]|uniref:DUF4232 domain-containing protein n=1 Tax=Streptomyces sp. SID14478 TaxID=2706073 RepID=UPI0013DF8712|nr:DUF4232 domain-containing protein [Streptomyces sp. SID14478]NEB82414.1 DUF4232 domain-containing protein [Streptomyces sp. SID14478]
MNSKRTSRTRLLTAAASVAIAALSLTACDDGSGVEDEGPSSATGRSGDPTGSALPTSDGKPATSTPDDAPQGTAKAATRRPGASKPTAPSAKRTVCDGAHTRTTAAPVNRPVNHMLLTVTNTGSTACDLYFYPAVSFGEAQSVPPVIEDSQPQAVVSLSPGRSGYAAVALSATDGSGANGHTAKSLTVFYAGPGGPSDHDGPAARPALPAKGVYVDDSLKVTYWQQSMDDALSW